MNGMNYIDDPNYWRQKMQDAVARGEIHRSIFTGTVDAFAEVEARQKQALENKISNSESVLDVGCGYGRLLDLLPKTWKGDYLGVDISSDLIGVAHRIHPNRDFICTDIRRWILFHAEGRMFDVAVCLWMRTMMLDNGYKGHWEEIAGLLEKVAKRLIIID